MAAQKAAAQKRLLQPRGGNTNPADAEEKKNKHQDKRKEELVST